MAPKGTSQPKEKTFPRWFGSSDTALAQVIRCEKRLLVIVVNTFGDHSGWFEAVFAQADTAAAFDRLWEHPDAGLPRSRIGRRFDPDAEESMDDIYVPIPLWKEPVSDIWAVITHGDKQNWVSDLQPADWACGLWAKRALHVRTKAAGDIQILRDRQELDGVPPIVDETGLWIRNEPMRERLNFIGELHPLLKPWFAATLGPQLDARRSYEIALEILCTPKAMFEVVSGLHHVLHACEEDDALMPLWRTLDAALLDTAITAKGTRRPWLANTGFQLEIRTIPIDMNADLDDIERLWQAGLQIHHLLDAGERIGSSDFPAPWDVLTSAMENVFIEGTQEDGYAKVQALLQEAQEARQWSIPWGARVEVAFGPFVALKIFEREGEFSCHFLDAQDRYLLLPIGLQGRPPKIGEVGIFRKRSDDGAYMWNHDAEIALCLIAAAIVRDFLVVEDRTSLFNVRSMRRRLRGGRNVNDIVYLPRVRYTTPYPERMTLDDADKTRARHQVSPHLRKAGTASTGQRFLAQRYGMELPAGFTFVRPHERGTESGEVRVKIYRSRSASRMIFEEMAKAPEGSRPEWFEFEKDCARILRGQGMRVVHQAANRSGDLGVDLYAVDATGQSWVVQCKCWAKHRPVGPDVVRELVGAIASSDRGMTTNSRGMIITAGSFTSGAVSEAIANGFELVDGIRVAQLLE
ncbi:MAG: restriction endonuclease [Rhodoferax sp.]|nr:restriction endonuclease [Rhodoferax sp.]